jgi:hypothetical protein
MNRLELKHLTPYLPYHLEIQVAGEFLDDDPEGLPRIFTMVGILDGEVIRNKKGYISNVEEEIEDVFPILRPLSDLTLDVINKFYENKAENGIILRNYITPTTMEITLTATYKMMGDAFTDFIISRNSIIDTDYWLVELLLKHHFDVFGLIEKGLAIDINTL